MTRVELEGILEKNIGVWVLDGASDEIEYPAGSRAVAKLAGSDVYFIASDEVGIEPSDEDFGVIWGLVESKLERVGIRSLGSLSGPSSYIFCVDVDEEFIGKWQP